MSCQGSKIKRQVFAINNDYDITIIQNDEIAKTYEKKISEMQSSFNSELEETKRHHLDLYRKLEQRCFRLENEKQSIRRQNEQEIEELKQKHKQELQQSHEKKIKAVEDARKECETKVSHGVVCIINNHLNAVEIVFTARR